MARAPSVPTSATKIGAMLALQEYMIGNGNAQGWVYAVGNAEKKGVCTGNPDANVVKECYADEPIVMPLEGIHVDDKLQFVEEPVEIMEREIKRLKRSRIPLVKGSLGTLAGP
ncbi:hypothetical protein Tco_0830678 [Tanacetum coccineum]